MFTPQLSRQDFRSFAVAILIGMLLMSIVSVTLSTIENYRFTNNVCSATSLSIAATNDWTKRLGEIDAKYMNDASGSPAFRKYLQERHVAFEKREKQRQDAPPEPVCKRI
jgi:hypothetical protein